MTSDIQSVTLLASVPLTGEDWQPLPKNTIIALSQGEVVARASSTLSPEPRIDSPLQAGLAHTGHQRRN